MREGDHIPVLTFFNNKGGVGKTSLIYHLAWMYAELGKKVVVVDADPQSNLTAAFLSEEEIALIWQGNERGSTLHRCVNPLAEVSDIDSPRTVSVADAIKLIPGDVALSGFEDSLSSQWPDSLGDRNLYRPMRILSAFWQVMQIAARSSDADLVMVDIGPNLGAINRSVLLATDYVVIPLGADLFSLMGLRNLGPELRKWRTAWKKRIENWRQSDDAKRHPEFVLPPGEMRPIGYLCQQYGVRLDRPVKAYDKWVKKIPSVYRKDVLGEGAVDGLVHENDPHCLATIKHFRSLVPMGQECRKPIFKLTSADGAIGSHANAVQSAREDFKSLANKVWERMIDS